MPLSHLDVKTRIKSICTVISNKKHQKAIEKAIKDARGNWSAALTTIKSTLPDDAFGKADMAYRLADWSDDHVSIVRALSADQEVKSLRDVALHFNVDKLAALVDPARLPDSGNEKVEVKCNNFATRLNQKLFNVEPTAVLHRMVRDAELPIASGAIRSAIA